MTVTPGPRRAPARRAAAIAWRRRRDGGVPAATREAATVLVRAHVLG
ncbi:hypothetical protein ACIBI3_35055 [Actinomadura luteofluorescens]